MKESVTRLKQRLIAFGLNPSEWRIEVFGQAEGLFHLRLTSRTHEFMLEGRADLTDWIWLRMIETEAA
jgi:hypothetical protein